MAANVAFQPGKFTPVVEVAMRDNGQFLPAETDFSGLEEITSTTLSLANARARGSGAVLPDPVPGFKISMIIGFLLAARNVAEQLSFLGIVTKFSGPLRSAQPAMLEPLVRAYNYYGHFELHGKQYVARGLETHLLRYLFKLVHYATAECAEGTKHTVAHKDFANIDSDWYSFSASGEIVYSRVNTLYERVNALVNYISQDWEEVSIERRLGYMRQALDVSTESGLSSALRFFRSLPGFKFSQDQLPEDGPSAAHRAAMKAFFGGEFCSPGDVVPTSKFSAAVSRAYQLLRRVTDERSAYMKTCRLPRYEGGSASQLGGLVDDLLTADTPLSLADSTAALALTMSHSSSGRFRMATDHDKDELRRELVSQSLL